MVADVSRVCFVLFFSDRSKTSNQNTERVNCASQQSENHLEGNFSFKWIVIVLIRVMKLKRSCQEK